MNSSAEKRSPAETSTPPYIPFPELGEHFENVPIYVRPDIEFYAKRMGFLPDTIRLYLHVPWVAEAMIRMNNALMRDERNALSEETKYRLSMIASRDNECAYCTSHHVGVFKKKFGYDEKAVEDLLRMHEPADERERLAQEFVHQASLDARGVTDELRARMAKTFSPQEYMEIILLVGFWKMYNTMHNAMGVESEPPVAGFKKFVNIGPAAVAAAS
ncbi:MAG: carboxymuconolactone decarboxylase family protein [Opitutaceae bacterium]|nr:carboxymuconolactone decarboxylase family protein [Opitutaceae bacterium]